MSVFAVELGLGGGLTVFTQEFESRGQAPSRVALAPFVALGAGVLWELSWGGLYVSFDLAAETHLMRLRRDAISASEQTAQFALRASLGVGRHF
jgi:hypothetical protein